MKYCPNCGNQLNVTLINKKQISKCDVCTFIDWKNSVYIGCVVVAYYNDNSFVMIRLNKENGHKITFPGGYRDFGETLEQAAKREFNEETGMEISNLKLYKTFEDDNQKLVWIVYKGKIDNLFFNENDESEGVILVNKISDIDIADLRGSLTRNLLFDLLNQ